MSNSILYNFTQGRTPRAGQRSALETIEKEWTKADVFVVEAPTGCHAAGQGILLYSGEIRTVENIQVGDLLMGPDSTPRRVLNLHYGKAQLHTVVPTKGQPFTVNAGHILTLKRTNTKKKEVRKHRKDYKGLNPLVNIDVQSYLERSKTFKRTHLLYRVPVEFPKKAGDLPLDPYLFGLWLGDGTSARAEITTADQEIVIAWKLWAETFSEHHLVINTKPNNKASTYRIVCSNQPGKRNNGANSILRNMGVLRNKHIPQSYLCGSRTTRLHLLAGLLDTDGSLAHKGFDFIQKNLLISNQVAFLSRSLGLAAYVTQCIKKDQNGTPGTYYRVSLSGNTNQIPTRLPHKKALPRLQKKDILSTGFTIENAGRGEYFGFEVDGDNLYLLDDFTVTHNSGKSDIALTIARWASRQHKLRSLVAVPNNVLLEQYTRSNPQLTTLKAKHDYECINGKTDLYTLSCKEYASKVGHCCKGTCPYTAANRRIRAVPYAAVNYYTYMAHRLYPDVLLLDEAHNLLGMLRDMAGKKLWQHTYNYPSTVKDYRTLLRWVKEKRFERSDEGQEPDAKLELLHKDLTSGAHRYLVERTTEPYFGEDRPLLKMLPIDTSDAPPVLWPPSKVKKLVLLSATIGPKDLEQMGLDKRRVCWISTPSPIPPEQRRVIVPSPGFDLSFSSGGADLPNLAEYLRFILDKHEGQRGILHVTYPLMEKLASLIGSSRVITHTKGTKKKVYADFLTGPVDQVLMCAGLFEGIDLPGDLGRFQVICKVPWPSLAEPAYAYLAETDRMRYSWECLRTVMQGAGRVCRGPEDWGTTYIADKTFENLPIELQPGWFREAIQAGKVVNT